MNCTLQLRRRKHISRISEELIVRVDINAQINYLKKINYRCIDMKQHKIIYVL